MKDLIERVKKQLAENHPVEAKDIQALANGFRSLIVNCWDLRCESVPMADTGDYSIQWVVYEHYQRKGSKAIGHGKTPLEAISDAEFFIHGNY